MFHEMRRLALRFTNQYGKPYGVYDAMWHYSAKAFLLFGHDGLMLRYADPVVHKMPNRESKP